MTSTTEDQNGLREALARAEAERDALLQAAGFRPGPFRSESVRSVILGDVAGMRPAMVKARRAAERVQSDADLWTMRMLEEWPGDTLLLRLWRQRRETAASLRAAEAELDEERQESARLALAVTEGQAEITRLKEGVERIAGFPENYDKDGQSWGVGYAFYAVRKIARATLSPKEQP